MLVKQYASLYVRYLIFLLQVYVATSRVRNTPEYMKTCGTCATDVDLQCVGFETLWNV